MKIKVMRRIESFHVVIKVTGIDFWISNMELTKLAEMYNHAVVDDLNTMRVINQRKLVIWNSRLQIILEENMDTTKFFNVLHKIRPGIWITMDTKSFAFKPVERPEPVKSWVEIGKWILRSDKEALKNILNAKKLGISHLLKPILSRFVEKAFVYRDYDSKFSFSFNGVDKLLDPKKRIGLVGAIICHGIGENTFSAELCPKEGIYYSVHT